MPSLHKSMKDIVPFNSKPCNPHLCRHYYPIPPHPQPLPLPLLPPPPPPLPRPRQTSTSQSLTPFLILMFCGLAVSFVFIWYLACTTRYRRRRRVHELTGREPFEGFVNEDLGPVMHYPIWLIDTAGLDPLQIESIDVFKYKRDEKMIEGTDCSVCLSEFEDDDTLRLLPKCSHAFHVPCIDTWLRSHKNCPLCRAPIFNNTNDRTESNSVERSSTSEDRTQVDESEFITDGHVVEVDHNIGEIGKASCNDHLADHHHVAMRRSVSIGQLAESKKPNSAQTSETKLNGSSSSVNVGHKVMKSSSLARSLRKARSFTSSYRTHDRSY